jgi:hypothetical protein
MSEVITYWDDHAKLFQRLFNLFEMALQGDFEFQQWHDWHNNRYIVTWGHKNNEGKWTARSVEVLRYNYHKGA